MPDASAGNNASSVCDLLADVVKTVFPTENEYNHDQQLYYSGEQVDLLPACRVLPRSAEEVSATLRLLGRHSIPFAVKGGGHTSIPGASNIDGDGVTIDLSAMTSLDFFADDTTSGPGKKSVLVGAGWRWGPLYVALGEHGLTVSGGRINTVGVSGYLLGGGLNFYGSSLGWACKQVVFYEIVLGNGTVINATKDSHPELFWSLHGSNLVGIVTRFGLETMPNTNILAQGVAYDPSNRDDVNEALVDYAHRMNEDTNSGAWVSTLFLFSGDKPGVINQTIGAALVNTNSTSPSSPPPSSVFDPFLSLPSLNIASYNTTHYNLSALGEEPLGLRQWKATLTIRANPVALSQITLLAESAASHMSSDSCCGAESTGFVALYLQPLPLAYSTDADIFGLHPDDTDEGPLMMFALQVTWSEAQDDSWFTQTARWTYDQIVRDLGYMGALHRFRYRNYAAGFQDVYASYGEESRERLGRVVREYDEEGVFERLVPGGHKLR